MKRAQKILVFLILQLICFQQFSSAQDSLAYIKPEKHKFKAEPLRATMLAVAFPGMGQVYNRKYWKIPVVYAGFGALFYSAGFNSRSYTTYVKAYQDFTDLIPETNSYLTLIPANPTTYDPVLYPESYDPSSALYYKNGLLRMVDYYKRYRDLSYIGIAAWYLLSILDANVDASLYNFDVSNNLDITFAPMLLPLPGGYTGAGITANIRLTF